MKPVHTLLFSALLIVSPAALANIDIVFDYRFDTSGYFSNSSTDILLRQSLLRQSVLESAASVFENRFGDTLSAITSSGANVFNASFYDPSSNSPTPIYLNDFSVATNQVVIFVGAYNLGTGTLGQGGPGGYNASGTTDFLDTVDARGETGALNASPTDFGPWGGSIAFNNTSSFYFDDDTTSNETFTGFDFYSIAVHELGHVLGFGTSSSYSNAVSGNFFTGDAVVKLTEKAQPLTTDGHWENTVLYLGQETSMDPDIAASMRTRFTELDFAAMKDIGWEVSPVPEVETWGMMLAGLGLLGWRLRARTNQLTAA